MTACKYLKNPKLMGYELDEELWAAGIIISRLSDLKMELHLQEEIPASLYETCDLVISNPVYGTDTIKDDSLAEELPSELRTVRRPLSSGADPWHAGLKIRWEGPCSLFQTAFYLQTEQRV